MYTGHAAIALALSRRERRPPIALLALAAFGPDWFEVVLMLPVKQAAVAIYTHSIPAVLIGAAVATGLYAATRRPGARIVFLAWLLHWPTDLFTGRKPIVFREPLIGLDLYRLPAGRLRRRECPHHPGLRHPCTDISAACRVAPRGRHTGGCAHRPTGSGGRGTLGDAECAVDAVAARGGVAVSACRIPGA